MTQKLQFLRKTLKFVDVDFEESKFYQFGNFNWKFFDLIVICIYFLQIIYLCHDQREFFHSVAVEPKDLQTFELFELRREFFDFVLAYAENFEGETAEATGEGSEVVAETINCF